MAPANKRAAMGFGPMAIAIVAIGLVGGGAATYLTVSRTGAAANSPTTRTSSSLSAPGSVSSSVSPTVSDVARGASVTTSVGAAPPSTDAAGNPVQYTSAELVDGNLATAWRSRGAATGARIVIGLPAKATITEIDLTNGYTKHDPTSGVDRYEQERRITSIAWSVGGGPEHTAPLADSDEALQHIPVGAGTRGSKVVIRILATTQPGDPQFDYTAISEIRVMGYEG